MATKTQVEAKLHELIARANDAGDGVQDSLADALPESRIIEIHVADIDARYWTEMSEGRLGPLNDGPANGADIRVRLDGDDLVDLVDGRSSLFSKYLAGHVHIDASVSDLMRLRRLAG